MDFVPSASAAIHRDKVRMEPGQFMPLIKKKQHMTVFTLQPQ